MSDRLTYFGIDLGTTYSAVAYIGDSGRPIVVPSRRNGAATTPSVVYFDQPGQFVVGAEAKERVATHHDRVVALVKRKMGTEARWTFDGVNHSPETISALILEELASDVRVSTGQVMTDVVITVPAYFGMLERDATQKAGKLAGLNVVSLVPEPVAAALQYCANSEVANRTVLVYDLGGGTFDTTVIRITPDALEVLCTDGDQELGGASWDAALLDHLVAEFINVANPAWDPREDPVFMNELRVRVEGLKQELSRDESKAFPIRFAGYSATLDVSRSRFDSVTRPLLEKTVRYTDRTLDKLAKKLQVDDPTHQIDEVLLVGGASRMPMIEARLQKYGWRTNSFDPDLAVVQGAARFALTQAVWDWDRGDGVIPTLAQRRERIAVVARSTGLNESDVATVAARRVTTVLPKSFGVKLIDSTREGWQADRDGASYVYHLVHANDPLPSPVQFLEAATLVDNQREIDIAVYEQAGSVESRDLAANKALDHGRGVITGLPPLPAGSIVKIEMQVNAEGLLILRATEPRSGQVLTINVQVSVLSDDQFDRAAAAVSALTLKP